MQEKMPFRMSHNYGTSYFHEQFSYVKSIDSEYQKPFDKYCIDILDQLKAAKNSIKSVEAKILKTHLKECVKETLAEKSDFDTKVEEILKVLKR